MVIPIHPVILKGANQDVNVTNQIMISDVIAFVLALHIISAILLIRRFVIYKHKKNKVYDIFIEYLNGTISSAELFVYVPTLTLDATLLLLVLTSTISKLL